MRYLSNPISWGIGGAILFLMVPVSAQNLQIFGESFIATPTIAGGQSFQVKGSDYYVQLKKIKVSGDESAKLFVKDRLTLFQSVFEPKRVDYPGQYSKVIECPSEFKPKYFNKKIFNGEGFFYQGYANKNKVAGACIPDLIAYRHLYGFVYCPSHNYLYEIEHFSSSQSEKLESFIEGLSCENP